MFNIIYTRVTKFKIRIDPTETILQVKEKIGEKLAEIPYMATQTLLFREQNLDNEKGFFTYGIAPDPDDPILVVIHARDHPPLNQEPPLLDHRLPPQGPSQPPWQPFPEHTLPRPHRGPPPIVLHPYHVPSSRVSQPQEVPLQHYSWPPFIHTHHVPRPQLASWKKRMDRRV
ncbi:hypothetical protein RIF29_22852 [Crotalaria pallida]|uniref:Ubiquitin-like domain-containing protein n=1 Tax=Crotalaria pallida TaxID=3830 RepID=A0AAN9I9M1_CROPI